MGAVDPRQAGMAAGVSSTMRYLGGILSIIVLGAVLGSDAAVTVERHVLMIRLFTAAIAVSALLGLLLPGRAGSPEKSK